MIIDISGLRKFEKTIVSAMPKVKERKKDSLFFNFKENKIMFSSVSSVIGEILFEYELEDDSEKIENCYFDMTKLFIMINSINCDKLTLKFVFNENLDDYEPTFYHKNDKYMISNIIEEAKFDFKEEDQKYDNYSFSQEIINKISDALQFVDEGGVEFNSVVFDKDKIWCVTPTRFYKGNSELNVVNKIEIHKDFANIIKTFESCEVGYSENIIKIFKGSLKIFMTGKETHTYTPSQEEIDATTTTETFIELDRKEILNDINFLVKFNSEDSNPIRLKFDDKNLTLRTLSDSDDITKSIEYIDSNLDNHDDGFNGKFLASFLRMIKNDTFKMYLSPDKNGITLKSEDNDFEVVIIKYFN